MLLVRKYKSHMDGVTDEIQEVSPDGGEDNSNFLLLGYLV